MSCDFLPDVCDRCGNVTVYPDRHWRCFWMKNKKVEGAVCERCRRELDDKRGRR